MLSKNAISFLKDEKSYSKFLENGDKNNTLILLHLENELMTIALHEKLTNSKCKIVFREVPDFSTEDENYKNFLMAFMLGQLSAEYSDLEVLSILPYKLPTSNMKEIKKRKATTRSSKSKNIENKIENPVIKEESSISKKSKEEIKDEDNIETTKDESRSIKEKPIKINNNIAKEYADKSFDEQYDKLMDLLSRSNDGNINPADHLKKIFEASKITIGENLDFLASLNIVTTNALAKALEKATRKYQQDILAIVSVIKYEI